MCLEKSLHTIIESTSVFPTRGQPYTQTILGRMLTFLSSQEESKCLSLVTVLPVLVSSVIYCKQRTSLAWCAELSGYPISRNRQLSQNPTGHRGRLAKSSRHLCVAVATVQRSSMVLPEGYRDIEGSCKGRCGHNQWDHPSSNQPGS